MYRLISTFSKSSCDFASGSAKPSGAISGSGAGAPVLLSATGLTAGASVPGTTPASSVVLFRAVISASTRDQPAISATRTGQLVTLRAKFGARGLQNPGGTPGA